MGDLSNAASPKPASLAHARVSVEPYAAAGLSIYAGVGGTFVSLGIEVRLTWRGYARHSRLAWGWAS